MLEALMPLHPKLVHFPIALFMTALIFELFSRFLKKEILSQAAILIFCFAALLTPLVVYAGLWEQMRLHLNHSVLEQHKKSGLLSLWISWISLLILWLLNRRNSKHLKNIFLALLLIVNTSIIITGYYGGKMVYEYGAGVSQ